MAKRIDIIIAHDQTLQNGGAYTNNGYRDVIMLAMHNHSCIAELLKQN